MSSYYLLHLLGSKNHYKNLDLYIWTSTVIYNDIVPQQWMLFWFYYNHWRQISLLYSIQHYEFSEGNDSPEGIRIQLIPVFPLFIMYESQECYSCYSCFQFSFRSSWLFLMMIFLTFTWPHKAEGSECDIKIW